MTQELLDLADRCEKADASEQRAVLEAAYLIINPERDTTVEGHFEWLPFERMLDAEAYESAAMMLVPEGWNIRIEQTSKGQRDDNTSGEELYAWAAHLIHDNDTGYANRKRSIHGWKHAYAATPALALVAACCRARAAEGGEHG